MKKNTVFAIGLIFGLFVTGAAFAYQFNFGALVQDNFYEDQIAFDAQKRFNLTRNQLEIPKAYGRLVSITSDKKISTLWFESSDGVIRNVNVQSASPIIINRKGELN